MMVAKKLLPELILPVEDRINGVRTFLTKLNPELEYNIVPISDPFGPAIVDESLQVPFIDSGCSTGLSIQSFL
jgi:phosphopantetheine adenylyltransferase